MSRIQQQLDDFKIRLKILELQEKFGNSNCGRVQIENKLIEIAKEFNKFKIKPSKHKTRGCNTPTGSRHCDFEGVEEVEK